MTEERTTPLHAQMIRDMRIRRMGKKAHIWAIKDFAAFLKRSPDTATPEELRAYQLHMTDTGVSPTTFNARIVALRFFFSMTCGREEIKRFMKFRTQPRKLPVVFSVEKVRLMPLSYVKPYVKLGKTDAADAEAICEAVTRSSISPGRRCEASLRGRFVPVKTEEQQAVLMAHRTWGFLVRQLTQIGNSIRAFAWLTRPHRGHGPCSVGRVRSCRRQRRAQCRGSA